MNVPQRSLGVGVEGLGVRSVAREIRFDGSIEPVLAELPENDRAERRDVPVVPGSARCLLCT